MGSVDDVGRQIQSVMEIDGAQPVMEVGGGSRWAQLVVVIDKLRQ